MNATPGQTVGPFFHYALPYDGDRDLVAPGTPGAIRLHGTVYDGAGAGVPDALLEIWQADGEGHVVQRQGSLRRDGHTFTGFGRASTDRTGEYTSPPWHPRASTVPCRSSRSRSSRGGCSTGSSPAPTFRSPRMPRTRCSAHSTRTAAGRWSPSPTRTGFASTSG
jgi:hypothetical protein